MADPPLMAGIVSRRAGKINRGLREDRQTAG
jgi:hypothetical protein